MTTTTFTSGQSPVQSSPTASSLVRVPSNDEQRYDDLLHSIDTRTSRLSDLEQEVSPLLRALEKFEWHYNANLGALQRKLRDLRAQTQTIEHWTARIHARTVADPNHMMGDLFDEDELREIGTLFGVELPESWFQSARESEDRRRQERADGRFDGDANDAEEEILRQMRGRQGNKHRLPEEVEREIRALHRSLARRFHPDLATTEAERLVCQEMMLRINAAWHDRDLTALRSIDEQSVHLGVASAERGFERRIHWARQECLRLDGLIVDLVDKLQTLRRSTTFPLWFNPTLAQTVMTQRASVLRMDYATEEQRLTEMKLAFRHALASYAVTVA